jgi:hypothetical protein
VVVGFWARQGWILLRFLVGGTQVQSEEELAMV